MIGLTFDSQETLYYFYNSKCLQVYLDTTGFGAISRDCGINCLSSLEFFTLYLI